MRFADIVPENCILDNVEATDKENVINVLIASLVKLEQISEADVAVIYKAVMDREELGSTGISNGVAIPHSKITEVTKTVCLFARSQNGVPFDAIDGDPIFIFFMLLSPKQEAAAHLEGLAFISRAIRDSKFIKFLRDAKTVQEIRELLDEADVSLA
jgi:mannitol/fructose-specific phosphotransferase system IIA component (Ntr-type)